MFFAKLNADCLAFRRSAAQRRSSMFKLRQPVANCINSWLTICEPSSFTRQSRMPWGLTCYIKNLIKELSEVPGSLLLNFKEIRVVVLRKMQLLQRRLKRSASILLQGVAGFSYVCSGCQGSASWEIGTDLTVGDSFFYFIAH